MMRRIYLALFLIIQVTDAFPQNSYPTSGNAIINNLSFGRYGSSIFGDNNPYQISSSDGEVHDMMIFGNSSAVLHLRLYDGDLKIGSNQTPATMLYNNGQARFGGSVGIGTTNPLDKLHVSGGNILTDGSILFNNQGYASEILKYQSGPFLNNTGFIFRTEKGGAGGSSVRVDALKILHEGQAQFVSSVSLDGNLSFTNQGYTVDILKNQTGPFPNNTGFLFRTEMGGPSGSSVKVDAMSINHLGNVGIGTTSPDAKLAVNGQIHATEVKVTATVPGPDYVFEEDYALPSLDSVQSYINHNKHLPEVPSAKEMEANGINLSEMNMLLLKKVEELTLYIIEAKQEIRELKKENSEIRARIKR